MRGNKRGQAVAEFLYVHGWALFAVLALLAALTYVGMSQFEFAGDEKCQFYSGIECRDFIHQPGMTTVQLKNIMGFDINNIVVTMHSADCAAIALNTSPALQNNEVGSYFLPCNLSRGTYDLILNMSYRVAETNVDHTKVGKLRLKVIQGMS